ncbi:hypothetical protein [Subtercola sp. RTI3]|uniref:hypothetical protein n=1 Tax=Subtercola sp. RTI3 TaxID=3048639 RepID=UPI002B229FD2|nr:hypothetical protein [Subtercola sp. RTI3]MEA9984623.1 hypothetical protein [Subtercola sp. RTI3]
MLGNVQGYHVLILLAIVVVVVVVIVVVVISVRRKGAGRRSIELEGGPAARMAQLVHLHDQHLVSDDEFEVKRREILREI